MLKFYIISVVITVVIMAIVIQDIRRLAKSKNLVAKKATHEFHAFVLLFIPIFNLLMAVLCIFCYEEIKEKCFIKCYEVKED